MLLLGIDFETSGLSPEKDVITEVGAVVWDTDLRCPVDMMSVFLNWNLEVLDPEVTKLTGITLEMLSRYGEDPQGVFEVVNGMATRSGCAAFVAHNGEAFDRPFYGHWGRRVDRAIHNIPWIDTQNDVPYPESIKTRKLTHLAAEHGFLNPFAHRAVFDVLTMFNVLGHYDTAEVLTLAQEPTIYLQACTNFNQKDLAKARGYRWNPSERIWFRSFKQSQLEKERREAGFETRVINKPVDC